MSKSNGLEGMKPFGFKLCIDGEEHDMKGFTCVNESDKEFKERIKNATDKCRGSAENIESQLAQTISKRADEELLKALQCCDSGKTAPVQTTTSELTAQDIKNAMDKLAKYELNIKPNPHMECNKVIVIDNEKARKEIPWINERGKTVIYNPENKELEEYLKSRGKLIK